MRLVFRGECTDFCSPNNLFLLFWHRVRSALSADFVRTNDVADISW